ncbi:tail fiber assembly protein [Thiohalocapsa marina]|uniref:tail fiber assembly protein n=1 Tax=Thiohalocapsa marina TaxID=424902 RepID=UPI0036DCAFD4
MHLRLNQETVTYPYSIADLRADNSDTSFPSEMSDALLASFGVYPVASVPRPQYDAVTQNISEGTPVQQGDAWVQMWVVSDASPAEVAARTADVSAGARMKRDSLLVQSDWTQVDDAPLSNVQKAAWAAYRQALRDIPQQAGFPWDVVWPETP